MSRKIKGEQKKFLGETLNQYDKALNEGITQLDKKNREQNHKISALTNSFDNDFLEKEEEGTMISLENSKDGMVIIDEIAGNSEVNYCKDGVTELTLNGDIDTQGESSVTITEGVDGGLVDVVIEGNTEINMSNTKDPVMVTHMFDEFTNNGGKLQTTVDDVTTYDSMVGKVDIKNIKGDTLVNHAVNGNEELILNGNIDVSGDNFITIDTDCVEGGKVDVSLEGNTLVNVSKTKDTTPITRKGEDAIGSHIALVDEGSIRPVLNGNTMVNVCDQKDPVAITKSYTVETGNHVALQGEYDGKCRPVVTGNTLVNLFSNTNTLTNDTKIVTLCSDKKDLFKPGVYTCINNTGRKIVYAIYSKDTNQWIREYAGDSSEALTLKDNEYIHTYQGLFSDGWSANDVELFKKSCIILEGDYTNKPIPEYFEGLKSSFEDKVVTQEMVDNGEELAENLGKYKVDYVISKEDGTAGQTKTFYLNSPLLEGDTIEQQGNNVVHVHRSVLEVLDGSSDIFALSSSTILEDTVMFEAFEERTYLWNSNQCFSDKLASYQNLDLLDIEGVSTNGCLRIRVNKSKLSSNTINAFNTYLQSNPIKVVCKLREGTYKYEVISTNDSILCDSYTNGHLDIDSVVPIERVVFKRWGKKLKYVYPSTQYNVQFESDNIGNMYLLEVPTGLILSTQSINKGINKFTVTTSNNITYDYLTIEGIGFNASNIVVTPAIEQDFDYFSGMQSCFEDNLVTEGENAGKYEVTYKVTGKNKLKPIKSTLTVNGITYALNNDGSITANGTAVNYNAYLELTNNKKLPLHGTYTISGASGINIEGTYYNCPKTYTFNKYTSYKIYLTAGIGETRENYMYYPQLEESTTATSYEPYKEYTKTLYLNSPLLEGDTIEEKDRNIYHVHRYNKVVLDGSEDEGWYNHAITDSVNTIRFAMALKGASEKAYSDCFSFSQKDDDYEHFKINNGNIFIYINKNKVPELNGNSFKQYLQSNPITVVHGLATPQYELIQQDTIAIPSYSAGHLDVTTAVPLDKVNFLHFEEELTYLYPSTQYTLQFTSDKAITVDITLGGKELLAQSIVAGLNRVAITTPSELVNNKLVISGVGANISKVVVTDTDREFGYFEGMKSVGEGEGSEIEILSQNKNLYVNCFEIGDINQNTGLNRYDTSIYRTRDYIKVEPNTTYSFSRGFTSTWQVVFFYDANKNFINYNNGFKTRFITPNNAHYVRYKFLFDDSSGDYIMQIEKGQNVTDYIEGKANTQTLTHEPLRAVGDTKDRYVLIDGKWYIERNCKELILNGTEPWNDGSYGGLTGGDTKMFQINKNFSECSNSTINIITDGIMGLDASKNWNTDIECISLNTYGSIELRIKISKLIEDNSHGISTWLKSNNLKCMYKLETPQYEPIDYNPFEVYSDITHISTNSTIPTNITVKNHGYNMVALKENTPYTLYVDNKNNTSVTYRLGDAVEVNSSNKLIFTTPATLTDKTLRITGKGNFVNDLMLIEGTPANDPVGYFDGLKSSYECEKVTDESDENYGKYRVDIKVVGKNLFDGELEQGTGKGIMYTGIHYTQYQNDNDTRCCSKNLIEVIPNTQYTASHSDKGFQIAYWEIDKNGIVTKDSGWMGYNIGKITFNTMPTTRYLKFVFEKNGLAITPSDILMDIQLEEGDTATEYEPYFESKQTVYLNSPLFKGDEIVWKDNKIQHYHKMGSVVLDGSEDEGWNYAQDSSRITTSCFTLVVNNGVNTEDAKIGNAICDKIASGKFIDVMEAKDTEGISIDYGMIFMAINQSKLSSQDVNGIRAYLQQNPITVVYELETPYYEEISPYPLKLSTKENCSLTTESNIQVTQISFNIYEETLAYLYPSTKYYISFNADISREIVVDLGGTKSRFTTQVGYNKIEITTPADTTNMLTFNGQGINIDHVMVTKQDIDEYFEGMKSVGECEELEVTSANSDNTLSNSQQLTHEPLRAVGNVKDKYVLLDGKWHIERNTYKYKITKDTKFFIQSDSLENYDILTINTSNFPLHPTNEKPLCDKFLPQYANWNNLHHEEIECVQTYDNDRIFIKVLSSRLPKVYDNAMDNFKEWLTNNEFNIIYPVASPTYEPIDYNPFETYTDITHISTNSLIPTNMVIKNHGYNCILKPSTKYTIALNKPNGTISAKLGGSSKVDSTNNIFTITTPSTLNDNVLRLSGSGKVKDIMILEGDKTVNTPSYFEGIESAFEQEYDAEKGKYRVTARVEGNGKKSSIIFYIDKPLRGTGTVKDKVFIQDGKVVVERNCSSSITFDGSADEGWSLYENKSCKDSTCIALRNPNEVKTDNFGFSTLLCDKLQYIKSGYSNDSTNISTYVNDKYDNNHTYIRIKNAQLRSSDKQGVIQWLQQNPVTVVYQLAKPIYEKADCDLSKLVLENYENSSLIFESNIPVSANIRYSGEVPVVTQAKSLSSQVDNTTLDINENIIPYMCDIDYRIVELQLMNGDTQGEGIELLGIGDIEILGNENVLFNNREDKKYNYSYDMLKRDILSQRYSKEEYQYRLDRYLLANKISDEEYKELEGLLNNGE